ncbi:MAG: hypothetical protein ABJO72_00995 [Hyphomicrobiales bacterium]
MSEVLQVKLFGGAMSHTCENENKANEFLASLDPSDVVSITTAASSFTDVPDQGFVYTQGCTVVFKTSSDQSPKNIVYGAATHGGVFSSEEAK